MLSNNIAYLFVEENILEFFNKTDSNFGMIIGSKIGRKGIVKEIIPLNNDFIKIFSKLSDYSEEILKKEPEDNIINLDAEEDENQFEISREIFSLNKLEVQKLEKICLICNMIPCNLYFMGIFIKCLNDESRPVINAKNIMKVLNIEFKSNLKDFIILTLNKITLAKLQCNSANFGEIDFKRISNISETNSIFHFSLKTCFEINRLFYVKDANYCEAIDNFYFSIKNIIENSIYSISDQENENINVKSSEILSNIFENINNFEYRINMMIPINLLDLENFLGKNSYKSEKIYIKFKSKVVLDFYRHGEMKYGDLISEVKNKLIEYIGENVEKILEDKFMDTKSPKIFSFDTDNKFYINYRDSIHLTMDQTDSHYSMEDIFEIFDLCYLENVSCSNGSKFYKINYV